MNEYLILKEELIIKLGLLVMVLQILKLNFSKY